ncbi:hypothetical protein [Nostoc sp. DedQUE09]|uniref:hypothetical protein n=1 Tax=Nostoc sp. DedQUE09 TaxID=3075394 RepID=UPI002AD27244|nr:hypothetical protein [Nostoc sp. DedQUE09]MDZ7954110.1 hypothetical protein [Nostoc sp. DedQUE09]
MLIAQRLETTGFLLSTQHSALSTLLYMVLSHGMRQYCSVKTTDAMNRRLYNN